jgi:hypothetical protein
LLSQVQISFCNQTSLAGKPSIHLWSPKDISTDIPNRKMKGYVGLSTLDTALPMALQILNGFVIISYPI